MSYLPIKVFRTADRNQTVGVRQLGEDADLIVVLELHAHRHDRENVANFYIGVLRSKYRAYALSVRTD